jgi:hypothetical protein
MTSRVKFGLERRRGHAPGTVHIDCPCGWQPEINLNDLGVKFVHCSRCGAEYDRLGFVLKASAWDHPEWRPESTSRARLWLLAHFGPVALKPDEWKYNPQRDDWAYVGRDYSLAGSRVKVTAECSASLARLERAWRVPRLDAMRMIDHPED